MLRESKVKRQGWKKAEGCLPGDGHLEDRKDSM